MATLPTFTDLTDEQVGTVLDAFKPHDNASSEESTAEFMHWLRVKVLAEVQRRLYDKLHSTPDIRAQEQEIVDTVVATIPDPDVPPETKVDKE